MACIRRLITSLLEWKWVLRVAQTTAVENEAFIASIGLGYLGEWRPVTMAVSYHSQRVLSADIMLQRVLCGFGWLAAHGILMPSLHVETRGKLL